MNTSKVLSHLIFITILKLPLGMETGSGYVLFSNSKVGLLEYTSSIFRRQKEARGYYTDKINIDTLSSYKFPC